MHPTRWNAPDVIYGTLLIVALLGVMVDLDPEPSEVVGAILGSSTALWLAHAYSSIIGHQLELKRYLKPSECWHVARGELGVVAVAPFPLALIFFAERGALSIEAAMRIAAWGGVAVLFLAGMIVAHRVSASLRWMLVGGLANAALGAGIIFLETYFAH